MKKTIILLLFVIGCSSQERGIGYLAVEVENTRGPLEVQGLQADSILTSSQWQTMTTDHFQVTVTGAGIDNPIVKTAEASATEIEVMGIPTGSGRTLLIESFNASGDLLRRREISGLKIEPGVTTPVHTRLNTIPRILNLKEGTVVLSKNFKLIGMGEPGSSLSIETNSSNESISLSESSGGGSSPIVPSLSSGTFEFTPALFLLGPQTITLTDDQTGESSSMTVILVEGESWAMRRFTSGGGASVSIGTGLGNDKEVHLPKRLHSLWKQEQEDAL